uniref:SOGA 1/2-like coiled-coil domain-containing protein n=1 Tax=Gasterosteus aculeatus TaxID=69293 RepID=G3PIV7_GASAC
MAAIDLERGLEHSGRAWGKERPELMDNFDSEMQEWEDQLQDIQRKIEELYNGVQARRGANDATADEQKNGGEREWGPAHRGESHPAAVTGPRRYGDGCKHSDPVSHQRDCGCCRAASGIGDLLQGYLGQEHQMSRKNNGARHVRFSDTIKVSPATERRTASGEERLGQETLAGSSEQTENRKNQVSHPRSSPNKENTGAKPPLGQRDAASAPPRSQPPNARAESPAPDRKAPGPAALGDRKCGSPSVLRKFGAMLQENEGKMLTESGVVAHQVAAPEPKSPTPGCQRRAPAACKAPARAPVQKCHADAAAPT